MRPLERAPHGGGRRKPDLDRRVRAGVAQLRAGVDLDRFARDALALDLRDRRVGEAIGNEADAGERSAVERLVDSLPALGGDVGEAHAVGREQRRQRMDQHRRDRQRVGDVAGVLAAGAAEAVERVAGHVVAARDRDRLDRLGHLGDRDGQKAVGDRLRAPPVADLARQRREALAHDFAVERLVAPWTEDLREELGDELAGHQVGVGDRERAAAAVARGAGIGAGGIRADAKARAVECEDRAAAGGDGVDLHHRRAHAHARDLGLEGALEFAVEMGDVGRGAAHVEADDASKPALDAVRAIATTPPAGPDRIASLPAKSFADGEAARRHHEHHARAGALDVELARDLPDVAGEDRREIGVDDRRVAAPDELDQRRKQSWLTETWAKPSSRAIAPTCAHARDSGRRA